MKKLLINPIILFSATNQTISQCGEYVIYIAVDKIVAAHLSVEEWKENNVKAGVNIDNYICDETETIITVDLESMENDGVDIAEWLSANTNYIDFERNYSIIEKAHVLDPNNKIELEYINETEKNINDFYFKSKSILDLKDNYGIDIYKPSYNNFIEVIKFTNPPAADEVRIASIQKYNPNSFSSALISAIVFKNLSQPIDLAQYSNCHFLFTILSNTKVILKFTYRGQSSYYDYSQDVPPRSFL